MTNETQNPQNQTGQTIIVNQIEKKSNGVGTAGFVLALISNSVIAFIFLDDKFSEKLAYKSLTSV